MSEKIYCKDCKWYEQGRALCHRVAPCVLPSLTDSRTYFSLFPCTAQDEYCGMAEKKEDDSCNSESLEYQHQVKINTLEDKIEFLKDTQTKGNATAGYKPEKSELKPINPPKRK